MFKWLTRSWKKKILVLILILGLILALLFIKNLSGPAKGTIKNLEPGNTTQREDNYQTLDGQNFSLSYPDNYQLETTGQHAVNILESYRLTATGTRGGLARIVAVTIYDVPRGNLYDTSGYKSRKDNPSTYGEKVSQVNGYTVRFMTNTITPETVAFIQKGSMVAAIGFSGGITVEGAQEEYDHIIESWRWR